MSNVNLSANVNNETMIFGFFNQYVFQEAKNNIEHLKYFFDTNIATSNNPLIRELLNAIDTYNLDAIGEPLFNSIFIRCKKTPAESGELMQEIKKWKLFTKEEIEPAYKYLKDVVAASIVTRAQKLYNQSPSEYLKYLKNINVDTSDMNVFSATKFNKVDINTIVAEDSRGAVSTNVEFINRAFAPMDGIERGQLGIICSPPGTGKSLEAMNLALWMAAKGEKVLYACLGDMQMKDFLIRMGSIAFGLTFAQSHANLSEVYDRLKNIVKDNLEISINPAGVVTADEIVEKVLNEGFTVAIVDYDGNLAGVSEGESMYNTYGDVYNTFTKLNLAGVLTIICAQPKIYSWNQMINMSDIGESSKKQHAADWIWTISNPNPDCPNHLYVMSLVKARRGNVGARAYCIRINARFIEIPRGLYENLRLETDEKNYTEQDIRQMIEAFNNQTRSIERNLQQQAQSDMPKININQTPFGKNRN